MTTERPSVECALQDDARLFAGVRAIVFHSAEQAGLGESTGEELTAATLDICREAFAIARKSSRDAIKLIVGGASDCIEITIDYPGDIPRSSEGVSIGKACAARGGTDRFGVVDQVRCENSDGRSRVTLIKHCDALKSESGD